MINDESNGQSCVAINKKIKMLNKIKKTMQYLYMPLYK